MRQPHVVFSVIWFLRYAAMMTFLIREDAPLLLFSAAMFFPIEAVGVFWDTGKRDTLSEIWTWVLRNLSKHKTPASGWNWLAVIFAVFEAGSLNYIFDFYVPAFDVFGDVMCMGLAAMLHAHWLRPDIHG